MPNLIPVEIIEQRILLIRGEKVMIDRDLAELYGVATKALNQAVRRNKDRFPENFMFQLMKDERDEVVTNCDHLSDLRFSYRMPYAFTEHGVAMLSSVLKSKRAIQVNIQIMNTFVQLRRMLADNKALALRLDELERKYDAQFKVVFDALRKLIAPPDSPKRPIGFRVGESKTPYIVIKRKS
ncbi:MAG: ORF6N domain-containing protein [Ignavibacteriae bacterium]|nr:ORF6N domain-containing protein [Ignavibacteriota bacterium]